MPRDPFKSSEWKTFANSMRRQMVPRMQESDHVAVISPDASAGFDLVFAVQIGAAILMNKPLVVIVPRGKNAPPRLLSVADKVIYVTDDDPGALDRAVHELRDYARARQRANNGPH